MDKPSVAYVALQSKRFGDTFEVRALRKDRTGKAHAFTFAIAVDRPNELAEEAETLGIELPSAKESAELIAAALNMYRPLRPIDWTHSPTGHDGYVAGRRMYYIYNGSGGLFMFNGDWYPTVTEAKAAVWLHHMDHVQNLFANV